MTTNIQLFKSTQVSKTSYTMTYVKDGFQLSWPLKLKGKKLVHGCDDIEQKEFIIKSEEIVKGKSYLTKLIY